MLVKHLNLWMYLAVLCVATVSPAAPNSKSTDWFKDAGYGVFMHLSLIHI